MDVVEEFRFSFDFYVRIIFFLQLGDFLNRLDGNEIIDVGCLVQDLVRGRYLLSGDYYFYQNIFDKKELL